MVIYIILLFKLLQSLSCSYTCLSLLFSIFLNCLYVEFFVVGLRECYVCLVGSYSHWRKRGWLQLWFQRSNLTFWMMFGLLEFELRLIKLLISLLLQVRIIVQIALILPIFCYKFSFIVILCIWCAIFSASKVGIVSVWSDLLLYQKKLRCLI